MNSIFALCHFCENHGPRTLLCVQCVEKDVASECLNHSSTSAKDLCEACQSFPSGQLGFISEDPGAGICYLSSQYPREQKLFTMVRQVCVQSLNSEVTQTREGPIFFGSSDPSIGNVFSYGFHVSDAKARGMKRWYSVILLLADKMFLLNSWPFLVKQVKEVIVEFIQKKAEVVYEEEQRRSPERARRLHSSRFNSQARSLVDLTKDPRLFLQLHLRFTWLQRALFCRLSEKYFEAHPLEESWSDFSDYDDSAELPPPHAIMDECQDCASVDKFTSLSQLAQILGKTKLRGLIHHLVVGNQVIVRGQDKALVESLLEQLQRIIPRGCCRLQPFLDHYVHSYESNLLGLQLQTSFPEALVLSEEFVLIEIRQSAETTDELLNKFSFRVIFHSSLSEEVPLIVEEIERMLFQDPALPDTVLEQFLQSTKKKWLNKVEMLYAFRSSARTTDETATFLSRLGVHNAEDEKVLKFWQQGLSSSLKEHIRELSRT